MAQNYDKCHLYFNSAYDVAILNLTALKSTRDTSRLQICQKSKDNFYDDEMLFESDPALMEQTNKTTLCCLFLPREMCCATKEKLEPFQ